MLINKYEYQLLTHTWDGPTGAAHNACYEFCVENNLMDREYVLTDEGKEAIQVYETVEKMLEERELQEQEKDYN